MSFLDFFWLIVISFAFIAYLLMLFQIIGDLFRDQDLNGWWKALWIIFLFVLPFLSALVYLIARGRGMAERQVAAAKQAQSDTNDYIRSVASSSTSPADQISQAKQLLDSGAISEAEFQALKAKALA